MQRSLLLIALIGVFLLLGLVQAIGPSRVTLYKRVQVPQGWNLVSLAHQDAELKFTVILKGENAEELEELFWQVSDPHHQKYQQYLTPSQIKELVSPTPQDLATLYSAFAAHGITQIEHHGDSFIVTGSVASLSSFFATEFYNFLHLESGLTTIRQFGSYSIPAHIAPLVDMILDIHTFPTIEQRLRMKEEKRSFTERIAALRSLNEPDAPTPAWIPRAIADVYGVPFPLTPLSDARSTAGVVEWIQETFSPMDLKNFSINTKTPLAPVDAHHIFGNNSEAPAGLESSLDIQWLEGIAASVTPWFWLESNPSVWMYTFTVDFLSAVEYPMVVSLSYGLPEIDQCAYFNPSDCYGVSYAQYIKNVDKQFMKMGLIGVSVIVCSQDRGTYAPAPPMTSNTVGAVSPFLPEYPGTSPYITSVGATEMGNPVFNVTSPPPACVGHSWTCISGGDEQAVSTTISFYLSGGGFSDVDERPRYQASHVERYINSNVTLPPAGAWNRTGRGFPDVSAMGYNGYIIDGNREDLVSGTSMSTPIFAAIVALLNAEYLDITGRTLGFLNPILYDGPADIFKDITVGDNCRSPQCTSQQDGFSCTVGWDPVTGLGTPRYPELRRYVRELAENVITREQAQQQKAQIQHQQQPLVAQKHSAPSKVKSVHGNVLKRMNGERQSTIMKGSMQM